MSNLLSLTDAIRTHLHDGDCVALEGFTHLIPFAAGHEIIRQRRRDLTLVTRIDAAFGRLDAVVNCARTTDFVRHANLDAMTEAMWDRILAVNTKVHFS